MTHWAVFSWRGGVPPLGEGDSGVVNWANRLKERKELQLGAFLLREWSWCASVTAWHDGMMACRIRFQPVSVRARPLQETSHQCIKWSPAAVESLVGGQSELEWVGGNS